MARNNYDPKENWKERGSTSVVIIILTIVSLLLFVTGATMLSIWATETEREKIANSEENQVLTAVREHYNLQASWSDACVKLETKNDKKYYIAVVSERVFKVEGYDEDNHHVFNLEEMK